MTTARTDHAAEALKHIEWAHEQQEQEGDMGNVPRDNALLAQVHATLVLVEQQRIANLISYAQLLESQYAEAAKHPDEFDHESRAASVERHGIALGRIREGLGL